MGTDNLELLDRRAAEIIIHGSETDLIALVESRTRPFVGPPVWRDYWDASSESTQEFPPQATVESRIKLILSGGVTITEVKSRLIQDLCTGDWLNLDYWGCMAEVFNGGDPPGSTLWEDFLASMFQVPKPEPVVHWDEDGLPFGDEISGRYLLTGVTTDAMNLSLRNNLHDLRVMRETDIVRLERWHNFCARHPGFCVVYQIDC